MSTLKELLAQQAELTKKIEEVRKVEVAEAIKKVKAVMEEYQLSIEDVFPQRKSSANSTSPGPKTKGIAKYQNKIDPKLTWTGKGRKPEWVITFLANGGTLEELEIK